MNHVTDIREAGEDASVLTDAGSGGLIGRGVLSEAPLADHLEDDETPRYVLRNGKHGVTVERPDGTDEYRPDRGHSGVAVVSDVRVLFAAGQSGDDVTLSVPLADVVDVRTEDGLIGGAFVVETVADERYRFPCRGDLDPVREYVDAAVGVWTRAQRHVEEAREQTDRLRDAFESGNADVVLAATGDVEGTLAEAREAADALDGARVRIDERAAEVSEELAALERRAHAEYAEQARERAHVRWGDGDYEAAMDDLDEAKEAYAAAAEIDADEPGEDLLAERRETLAEERDRLSEAPVDRAEHAVDVAAAAADPGPAVDWWETAVERYETALSLDWGRDERRFAGDPESLRDDLADATRELVDAHCDRAREHLAEGDDRRGDHPDRAKAAYDRAADALAAAREVAHERVPDAVDDVDAVAATLEDRLERLPGYEQPEGAEVDGGRTATVSRPTDDADEGSETESDRTDESEDDSLTDGAESGADAVDATDSEDEPGDPTASTAVSEGPVDGEPLDEQVDDEQVDEPVDGPEKTDAVADSETTIRTPESEESGTDEAAGDGEDGTDRSEGSGGDTGGADVDRASSGRSDDGPGESGDRPGSTDGSDDGASAAEGRESADRATGTGSGTGAEAGAVTDPASVDPEALPSLVARVFESAGWSTTVFGRSRSDRYDLLAATDEPVSVTVCVWTLHPETVETVDAATVDRYADHFESVDTADAAALCSAAPVSERARARATDRGFELLEADDLAERVEALALDPAEL